uniref:Metalloendopeptidase n=1 Tax=Knipowitschia caucasica TaxID=637954 RepID=A0AAV2LTQ7_KNICA
MRPEPGPNSGRASGLLGLGLKSETQSQALPVPDTEDLLPQDENTEDLLPQQENTEDLLPQKENAEGNGIENDTEDIGEKILASNNHSAAFLEEGDLLPSKKRNAIKCRYNSCRWPKGSDGLVSIPYTVSRAFNSYENRMIEGALGGFASKTCIRFVPRRSERDFIRVENRAGCFSSLGKQGGRQVLSLNKNGCVYTAIIQHEFNHALGFKHE